MRFRPRRRHPRAVEGIELRVRVAGDADGKLVLGPISSLELHRVLHHIGTGAADWVDLMAAEGWPALAPGTLVIEARSALLDPDDFEASR